MKKMLIGCGMVIAALCGAQPNAAYATEKPSFADFDAKARAGEKMTVVYFGGSLTWSANATEPNRTGFRGLMSDYLTAKYPKAHFTFVDASIGGTGSNLGMFRLERDVLAYKPDLVFLDFSCNDGGENTALAPTCCYEYLLRTMIGKGVAVQQMIFTFKGWSGPNAVPAKCHPRRDVYLKLAEAYGTPVGDVYKTELWQKMKRGEVSTDEIWPIDGGHPDDVGYKMFADAGIAAFEKAVAEKAVCRVPEKPVLGTVENVVRLDPAYGTLPEGWTRKLTYRTSLWYDGLSSRWMRDVAAFSGSKVSALTHTANANFFGVFGEADENALEADVIVDGKKAARFRGTHGAGPGRLFIWRNTLLKDWQKAGATPHQFALQPIPSANPKGEFRVGSLCFAKIVPSIAADDNDGKSAADALEKLDHARGK